MPGDVGGEEVDAVPVEVPAGAVVVSCGSGVGLMCRGIPAAFAIRATIR